MKKSIWRIICILIFAFSIEGFADSVWVCSNCGQLVQSVLGDICPYCGAKKHEHSWREATCTEPKTCSECGETEGEALGHQWDEGTVVQEATFESTGVKSFKCLSCGETRNEILPQKEAEITSVSCGGDHTAILKEDGTLWMCGDNYFGQLGDGTAADSYTPVQIMIEE